MSSTAPGWYPDPYQRHESRYWDGGRWTEHVSDAGATAVDHTQWGASASTDVPVSPEPPTWQPAPTLPPVATPPSSWGAPPSNVPPAPPTWGSTVPVGAWSAGGGPTTVDTRDRIAAIVGLAGAVVLLVSAFLPWFEVSVDFAGASISEDVSGIDGSDGVIIIVFALVAGALALLRLLGKGGPQVGVGLVAVGLLATAVGLIELGNDDPDTDAPLAALVDVSPSAGLWLVILAGLAVTAAGVLIVVSGRASRTAA